MSFIAAGFLEVWTSRPLRVRLEPVSSRPRRSRILSPQRGQLSVYTISKHLGQVDFIARGGEGSQSDCLSLLQTVMFLWEESACGSTQPWDSVSKKFGT